ncbi:hypothetical protein B0H13DRAFT_2002794 [Mycena leptocephala]|nr:hypothetical protein B0H13DRAFT_2064886 [Mycena leptocephala]KAJ7914481.1 hypothetical protein B0H13DRAFT_2002794 [Mycena leptocephala]
MSSIVTDRNPMLSEEPTPMSTSQTTPEQGQAQNTTALEQDGAQPPIVPFKERVIGVAKKTRGTLLGKPELKEHGEKILQGEASIYNIDEPPQSS